VFFSFSRVFFNVTPFQHHQTLLPRCRTSLHVHAIARVIVSEAEASLSWLSTEAERFAALLRCNGLDFSPSFLLIIPKVLFDNAIRLHVNLLIGIILRIVNLLHTASLFYEQGVFVNILT